MGLSFRADWHPLRALVGARLAADHATERGGEAMHEQAQRRVPFRTGALSDSAYVERDADGSVVVGYSADHAVVLRSHPEWQYRGGRSGRWLDEAAADQDVGDVLVDTLRAEWPRG